jgi:hypothetical protein
MVTAEGLHIADSNELRKVVETHFIINGCTANAF